VAPRAGPVVVFAKRPPDPLDPVVQQLESVLGRTVSLGSLALLHETAGFPIVNAAVAPGTALGITRTLVDLADAGVDQVRVVVRGHNSTAGTITVTVVDVTHTVELGRVDLTGVADVTVAGPWTVITPPGGEQELEVQVIGDGAMDPTLYTVSLQLRTSQARF